MEKEYNILALRAWIAEAQRVLEVRKKWKEKQMPTDPWLEKVEEILQAAAKHLCE